MIQVAWGDQDETLMVWRFLSERWPTDAFYEAVQRSNLMISSKTYTVDALVDLRRTIVIPTNLFSMVMASTRTRPTNVGMMVVVTPHSAWHAIYNGFSKTRVLEGVRLAASIDEAYCILEQERAVMF